MSQTQKHNPTMKKVSYFLFLFLTVALLNACQYKRINSLRTTTVANAVTFTSIRIGAVVIDYERTKTVKEKGHLYSLSNTPTKGNPATTSITSPANLPNNEYVSELKDLNFATTYYVRAYMQMEGGEVIYGDILPISTSSPTPIVTSLLVGRASATSPMVNVAPSIQCPVVNGGTCGVIYSKTPINVTNSENALPNSLVLSTVSAQNPSVSITDTAGSNYFVRGVYKVPSIAGNAGSPPRYFYSDEKTVILP